MSRRERRKEKTRSTIIDCAYDLFKSKGFQETSMEEIAEQSDVSKLTAIYLRYRMQTLFNSDPFSNPNRSGLENVVLEIIKDAQAKKELRSDIPSIIIARTFMLLAVNYFISNIEAKEPSEMDTLKNQLIELFLNGAKL